MKEYDYKEHAASYDDEVREYESYGHDVLFGMSYEFVQPGENILDLGIGTGLASIQFSKIGLKVYGLDISEEMLNVCRKKGFVEELKLHNLLAGKMPYEDNFFHHILSCGVFHFISELDNIFSEAARIMKHGGILAFSIAPNINKEDYSREMTAWGVPIYKHSPVYIKKLLDENGITLLKEQRLLMKGADKINYDMLFSVLIAKYK